MSAQNPFKTALIGSTALIGGSLLAPASALATSCPSTITGTALAGIVCDFDNTTGSSVTIQNAGEVGGLSMTAYAPASPSYIAINSGGAISNATGLAIGIHSSSLSGGITNSGTVTTPNSTGISIDNGSMLTGGIINSGSIISNNSVLSIDGSTIHDGITNSGTIGSSVNGTGIRIVGSSTITGGITNSGTITGSDVDSGIAIINNSTVSGGITNSGSINADNGNAIIMNNSVLHGNITNSHTIYSANATGISFGNISTVDGNITNQTGGSISGGADGIALRSGTMLSGGISNASGAAISGGTNGIELSSATLSGSINNSGTIFGGAVGISVSNTSSVVGGITNSGTVSGSTYGVSIDSNSNADFVNNGTITMNANSGHAIHNASNGNTITNNGTIAYRLGTTGIFSTGNNNTLTNNGFMEARFGIASNGTTNILTNNGTILSHGILGGGLSETVAGNSHLINNGSIITTGDSGYGLQGVDGNTLVNNGYIRTGFGIIGTGDGITVVNRGTIASGDSIVLTGDSNSVTLGINSFTKGTIAFTGTTNTLIYDVANVPRTGGVIYVGGTITGADSVTIANTSHLPAGSQIAQDGNSVAIVTPDQFSPTQQIITQTLVDAGAVLNNRQQLALLGDTTEAAGGTQYAASTSSLSDANDPSSWAVRDRKVAWAEGFGSYQQRGSDGNTLDSKASAGGVMAGIDLPQSDSGYRSGVYVGGFMGKLNVGSSFRTIDSTGGMAGGYIGKSFGGTYVSGQLGFGFSNNESDRFTGVDIASADYTSYFISPSLTVMHPVRAPGVTWVPSATVRYTAQFDDSYSESGAGVNESMDSRTTSSLDGRLMLEAKFDPSQWEYGIFKTSLRAGVQGQTLLGSNKVNVQTLGTNMSFDPKGGDGYVDGILGAGIIHPINERLDLYGDAEGNLGLNKGGGGSNKGAVGRIGARWKL